MLTTMWTGDKNIIEGDKIVKNSKAPHCYKWCWNNAGKFLLLKYEKDYVTSVYNKAFGQCLKLSPLINVDKIKTINDAHLLHFNNKDLWPFDMTK